MKKNVAWVLLRLSLGFLFFWAFLDKTFGLGFATSPEKSWIAGASPTYGYLKFATYGPFKEFFQGLAGNVLVDYLFMGGLFFVGFALLTGIAMRLASYAGELMVLLMWLSTFPPKNNPLIDEHIIFLLVFFGLEVVMPTQWSLEGWWKKTSLVKSFPILK